MLKYIIDRPITVTMALLSVVVLGLVSLRLLPVSLIPDVGIPYITVQVSDASLSAREMDESVVKPLREQLIQVGGLQDIVCESRDASGIIRLTFNHGSDIDYVFIEVNEKIDRAMSLLPRIDRPKVLKADASDIPAFFLNVSMRDGQNPMELSRYTKDVISKRLEQLPEVAMVDLSGTLSEEILLLPDEEKLLQAGLSYSAFEAAVSSADIRLGSLSIRDGEYRYNVKFDARAGSAEDLASIWIKCNGRLFQIKDLADVSQVPARRTGLVRSDGNEAVSLAVIKQREARMSELKKAVSNLLDIFEKDYPQLAFTVTRDQTELLEYSIHNLIWNIILGVILACLVIFLFMQDFRSPALVSLTIPSALVLSMLVFHLCGLTINIISLSGLLVGVGMMVDNTIILIDNITGRWNRGEQLRDAVLLGTRDVAGPMLSSVLTTCAVFVPLVFLSGIAGALFRDEAIAVSVVLGTSYLVTVTVIPVYYWWWYKGQPAFRPHPFLSKLSFDDRLRRWDHRRMAWWLDHRTLAWAIIVVAAGGIALCFSQMRKERLPRMTQTESILCVDWGRHLSVEENTRRCVDLEEVLGTAALQKTALVGAQQYVLEHSGEQGMSELQLYFRCPDMPTLEKAKSTLETYLKENAPEATWRFETSGNIFDMVFAETEAPLVARLRPVHNPEINLEELHSTLGALRTALPGISIPPARTKTDVLFVADGEFMALHGITYEMLASVLKNALNENRIFTIVQGTRVLPVVTGSDRENLSDLLTKTFVELEDNRIPVMAMMRQSYVEDLKTIVSGTEGDYYPVPLQVEGRQVPEIMAAVDKAVRSADGFEVSFSGSWFTNRVMVKDLLLVLFVALALLYLILASQFESLLQPLLILLEIVIDIFGALAVLWLLGESINLMSLIGLVVITGIVINDSILKIDTINKLRRTGVPLREAVLTASSRRMKAIIMTSLTTILAVAPFLMRGSMGADLQFPMSLVIIAGMTVGTLVSLFIVPALYYSVYAGKEHA